MVFGLNFLLLFFFPNEGFSQNGFSWDTWVGCSIGENDLKNYSELIEDNECHRVCQQSTVTYTMTGAVASQVSNTVWNVVGGTVIFTPNTAQCIVKWGTTDTGVIGYTTTRVSNNTAVAIANLCVDLTVNPSAYFMIAPVDLTTTRPPNTYYACTGQELFFENLSTANGGTPITSYWDFGDGTTSSLEAVSHTYNEEGTYIVTLKVDNQCNCSSTFSYRIEVGKKGVQIVCPSTVCEGQKATYSLSADFFQYCTQYNWSVIGGTILSAAPYTNTIEVLWNEQSPTAGFGYVTFDPFACRAECYIASTLKIPIIKNTAPIIGESVLCGFEQKRYKLPQWPTTDFVWEIENTNGATATIIPTDQRNEILLDPGFTGGTVLLKCRYTNTLLNCGGDANALTIQIKQPIAIIGAVITCVGSTETYTETNGELLNWTLKKLPNGPTTNFVGTNFTNTFAIAGEYSLTASGSGACTLEAQIIKVSQNTTPLATDFAGPFTVCPGKPTIYNFNNTIPDSQIRWQVTGGTVLGATYGNSVEIIFNTPPASGANYSIQLWRENAVGPACSSSSVTIPLILPQPNLVIMGETITTVPKINPCASSYATYQVATQDMDYYDWKIEPANAGNITVPNANQPWLISVLWNQFANQTATLSLLSKKCMLSYEPSSFTVNIVTPILTVTTPNATFCRGQEQTFTINSSPINLSTFSSILWDFGNGITKVTNTLSTTYTYTSLSTTPVNYQVKATITSPNGCTSIITTAPLPVTVKVAPVAIVTPNTAVFFNSLAALIVLPETSRRLTVTISPNYVAVNLIKWYKRVGSVNTLVQQGLLTTYVVTDFGTYYAELTSNTTNCSSVTNSVPFLLGNPELATPCPASFNPLLGATNSCGRVVATASNIGTPTSVDWTCSSALATLVSNTSATFNFTASGNHTITYTARYMNNGVECVVVRRVAVLVPYIADLKHIITCGTGMNYNVKLLDNSNFFSLATNYDSSIYTVTYLSTPPTTTTLTATQIANGILLPAGNYKATLQIKRTVATVYPACSKDVFFTLGSKPNVSFTKSAFITCPGEKVTFTLTPATINPNWTYLWTFGTNPSITNTQPNAFVTYTTVLSNNFVNLKVTDQYGCTFTTPNQQITVSNAVELTKDFRGQVKQCKGTTASILFPTEGNPIPVSYRWMRGNEPAPLPNNTNPYQATTSGNYWLQTANITGCFRRVLGYNVSVSFVDIPLPIIQTLPQVCLNQGVPLSSNIESNPDYQYIWRRDGAVISSVATLTDTPFATGTYTYVLEVRTPLGNSTFCSKFSAPKTVVVIEAPQITNIYYENEVDLVTGTCNPFRIKLTATANTEGTFTWSNGMSGSIIPETSGGAYQVLFTTASGCTATAQVYVPKDLTSYMWIVPQGCYTFCEKFDSQQLLGPAVQEFSSWAWLRNELPEPAGTLAVTTKDLSPNSLSTNSYQLQLANDACTYRSNPVEVTYVNCSPTKSCDIFSTSLLSATLVDTPFIRYDLTLVMGNTSMLPIEVKIRSENNVGFFVPSVVVVPPGGGAFVINLLPNSNLAGTTIDMVFTYEDVNGILCQKDMQVTIPEVIDPNRKGYGIKTTNNSLLVFPNPASDIVAIQYSYASSSNDTQILVYDTTSRLIARYAPTTNKGIWEYNLNQLAAGMYVVVMKKNGIVVGQETLIKK